MTLSVCVTCGKMKTMTYVLLDSGSQWTFYAKDCSGKLSIGGSRYALPAKTLKSKLIAEKLDSRIVFLTIKGKQNCKHLHLKSKLKTIFG